jgi:hypothetical protein
MSTPVIDGYRSRLVARANRLRPNSERYFTFLRRKHNSNGQKVDEAGTDLLQAGLDQHRNYQRKCLPDCDVHAQERG